MVGLRVLGFCLFSACATGGAPPPAAAPVPPPVTAAAPTVPASAPPPAAVDPTDPAALYGACRARVEGAESPGECTSDADCATAGCSGEVCTTTSAAAGVMTTCEVKACFSVLDRCGCVDGRCGWSLKPTVPPPGNGPVRLPPK